MSNLDCGLQDNLHLPGTKKNGADAPFSLIKLHEGSRALTNQIRETAELHLTAVQIAHRIKADLSLVENTMQQINTASSPRSMI